MTCPGCGRPLSSVACFACNYRVQNALDYESMKSHCERHSIKFVPSEVEDDSSSDLECNLSRAPTKESTRAFDFAKALKGSATNVTISNREASPKCSSSGYPNIPNSMHDTKEEFIDLDDDAECLRLLESVGIEVSHMKSASPAEDGSLSFGHPCANKFASASSENNPDLASSLRASLTGTANEYVMSCNGANSEFNSAPSGLNGYDQVERDESH